MKTKFWLLLIVLSMLICIFASCKNSSSDSQNGVQGGNANDGSDSGAADAPNVPNLIFDYNNPPTLVCNDPEALADAISEVQFAVYYITYRTPSPVSDSTPKAAHEIVFGQSNREISKKAYTYLNRIEKEDEDVAYLIYSDGSSIAIAFHEDRYHINAAAFRAAEAFADVCRNKEYVAIAKGTVDSLVFDALEYQEELDAAETEAQWKIFERAVNDLGGDGAAVTAAVKDYYARVCTDDIVSWFANLYDPVTGGFYFSNGARNTPGFLPDAESTSQAIGELQSSGMLDKFVESPEGLYIAGLPEWFRNQIVAFLKGLQDPETGYFYHPQWSKEEVNAHLSRRSRDMTKSCGLLKSFGSAPTYNTPSGVQGDGITKEQFLKENSTSPISALTGKLSDTGSFVAVSKVVPTASVAVAPHLVSDKTFKAYLAEQSALNAAGKRSFYAIGNEIGSQVSEIKTRDKALAEMGETYSLGKILIEWYNEHQDKETGLWDKGVNYDATNALLKIVGTYDEFGSIFPNADLALQSCLTMAVSEDEALTVCYVYNIWFAIEELIDNVNKYSVSADEKAYANSVRKTLLDMAPEAIRISAEKQLQFKKKDGSFAFTAEGNCLTSQGLRVGVPGDEDGDVNATVICLGGTIGRCLTTMGVGHYAPGFYTEADRLRFIAILEDLGPVIKDDINVPIVYEEFDNEPVGNEPLNISIENPKSGSLTVIRDPLGENSDDQAVQFVNNAGDYETVHIGCQSNTLTASCFVFESDFLVKSSSKDATFTQFYLQDAVYMINVAEENGKIKLIETSSSSWATAKQQDLLVRLDFNVWNKIKIEYYLGDHYSVRIKVFVNDQLIAITDNYYDKSGEKLTGEGTPKDRMDFVSIIGLSSAESVVLYDNMACYKNGNVYKAPTANEKQPPINVDPPERDLVVYDFEKETIPQDFTVTANDGTVVRDVVSGDGVLKISGVSDKGKTPSILSLPINVRFGRARCAVLDTNISVSQNASGTVSRFYFTESALNATPVFCFDLAVKEINGEKRVVIVEAPDGKASNMVDGIALALGEEFNLRVEYFEQETTALIYINDRLAGISGAACKNAAKYSATTLIMTGVAGNSYDITFDDLIYEKDTIEFSSSDPDGKDRVEHSFKKLPEGAVLSGGAEITDRGLKLGALNASIKLPLEDRNSVASAVAFSAKLYSGEVKNAPSSYVFTLADKAGLEIISFLIEITDDEVCVYEYYAAGKGTLIGTVPLLVNDFTLEFVYYYKQAVCNVKINGEAAGVTALTHLYDRDDLAPEYLYIKQISDATITITKCYAERALMIYKAQAAVNPEKPAEDVKLTFDTSSFGNLPTGITTNIATTAQVAIKALMNNGAPNKVLSFYTAPGNNDTLTFDMHSSKKLENAVATVFETDIFLDSTPTSSNSGVELYFRSSTGTNAYRIGLYFNEDDFIEASDYKNPSVTYSVNWAVKEEERFTLRMEYIVKDGVMKVNLFVNGEYVGTSSRCYQDSPIAVPDITRIAFYTINATDGTIYLDNTTLYHTLAPTEIPERKPGENFAEGGLTFEGMSSVWKDIDMGGTSSELPLDDKLIVRNTSTTIGGSDDTLAYLDIFTDALGSGAVFGKPGSAKHGEMYLKNLGGTGNCYVFDTQMQLGSVEGLQNCEDKWILKLGFTDNYRSSNSGAVPTLYAPFNIIANDDGSFTVGNKNVSGKDWINLTLEYYTDSKALVAYIDGEVVLARSVEGALESFSRVAFFLRKEATKADIKLDNMSAYVKEKALSEDIPEGDTLKPEIPVIDTEDNPDSGEGGGTTPPPTPPPSEDEEEILPDDGEPGKFNDKGQVPTKPDDAETNDGGGWT